ncbi:hypothetical protein [Streptomyces sp. NPDC007205]|uniref:TniB family NTP-binding protein n=1 Tax=Streptomyces sp. NPDC007205 TaxID=3154316 RepID=UPI00340129EE
MILGRHQQTTARPSLIVTGPAAAGKTTALLHAGRTCHLAHTRKNPAPLRSAHATAPVAYVLVPPGATAKTLITEFARYLGIPVSTRMTQTQITDAVCHTYTTAGVQLGAEAALCRICPERPAAHSELRLCQRHLSRWAVLKKEGDDSDSFAAWVSGEQPCPGYGPCGAVVCPDLADSPLGLCPWHGSRYRRDGRPGDAAMPDSWWQRYEKFGKTVPIEYGDQAAFRRWCASVPAHHWPGQINLRGLRPLVRAEIKWGLFVHTQRTRPSRWGLGWIRALVTTCRALK